MNQADEGRDVIVQYVKIVTFPCRQERETWPVFHMGRIVQTCRSRDDAVAVATCLAVAEGVSAWILDSGAAALELVWPDPALVGNR